MGWPITENPTGTGLMAGCSKVLTWEMYWIN